MSANAKLYGLQELADRLASDRRAGKTVVHVHGYFDLIGPSELHHFQAARAMGDVLVVTLVPDSMRFAVSEQPRVPQQTRSSVLAAFDCVDFVAYSPGPNCASTRTTEPGMCGCS